MTHTFWATALVVADLQESINFYRDKLELEVNTEDDGFADFKTKGGTLALLEERVAHELAGERLAVQEGSRPLILAWGPVDDVDALYKELRGKGVKFVVEPKTMPWGQRVAYFTDPDGNIWEISQETN